MNATYNQVQTTALSEAQAKNNKPITKLVPRTAIGLLPTLTIQSWAEKNLVWKPLQ